MENFIVAMSILAVVFSYKAYRNTLEIKDVVMPRKKVSGDE